MRWNQCAICGRFVGLDELGDGRAVRRLLTPDSDYTRECFETVHRRCEEREK